MKLDFSHRWVELMMVCVSFMLYSFIINGCQMGYLHPSRGLHQGVHFSHYLFLLCVEGLSTKIAKLEADSLIKGVPICYGAPPLRHLIFANDNLFFCRANASECIHVTNALYAYEVASRKKINLSKSKVCFSKNVKPPMKNQLNLILCVRCVS